MHKKWFKMTCNEPKQSNAEMETSNKVIREYNGFVSVVVLWSLH